MNKLRTRIAGWELASSCSQASVWPPRPRLRLRRLPGILRTDGRLRSRWTSPARSSIEWCPSTRASRTTAALAPSASTPSGSSTGPMSTPTGAMPACPGQTVMNGNSQFSWTFATAGMHTLLRRRCRQPRPGVERGRQLGRANLHGVPHCDRDDWPNQRHIEATYWSIVLGTTRPIRSSRLRRDVGRGGGSRSAIVARGENHFRGADGISRLRPPSGLCGCQPGQSVCPQIPKVDSDGRSASNVIQFQYART